jgi:Purple acid Phosphatase, N-terminal domain
MPSHTHGYGSIDNNAQTEQDRGAQKKPPFNCNPFGNMVRRPRARALIRGLCVVTAVALVLSMISRIYYSSNESASAWSKEIQSRQGETEASTKPSQIHIALHDATQYNNSHETPIGITVSWATPLPTKASVVRFGVDANNWTTTVQADVACEQYHHCQYTSPWFHNVIIDGSKLAPDTTYFCTLERAILYD